MTDVIRNINSNNQVSSNSTRSTSQAPNDEVTSAASSAASSVTTNERVELTGTAQQLDEIVKSLSSEPALDRQKIEDVKQALSEGRFEVNSSVIAERLLEIDDLLR